MIMMLLGFICCEMELQWSIGKPSYLFNISTTTTTKETALPKGSLIIKFMDLVAGLWVSQ